MKYLLVLAFVVLALAEDNIEKKPEVLKKVPEGPQQVHLSYFGNPTEMVVTWQTLQPIDGKLRPYAAYSPNATNLNTMVRAFVMTWTDEGTAKMVRYTYRATMTNLIPGKRYYYSVGSDQEMTEVFNFKAIDNTKMPRACIFGDFSILNGFSIDQLINTTQNGDYDIVFHIGDLAYDLQDKNGTHGDEFMNWIQPVAAYVPYMVIAGNHESSHKFNHLINRFTMPPNGMTIDNQFWSITINNTQFFGLSSEYYGSKMPQQAQMQYQFLEAFLSNSTAKWKIGFMHRPMYCSNSHKSGCQNEENLMTRIGEPGFPALEPLFNQQGVDMVFWGHEHSYERNYPVYKDKAMADNQSKDAYHNAETPVYILTGAAGCHSHGLPDEKIKQKYTAQMLGEFGFSVLNIKSDTELHTHFVDAKAGDHLDKFQLTKDPGFVTGQKN